ncbi:MAG: flagellar biosynthesis anti-sigma factor FlgM [Lachnospiraceae bacterium]|nr:flagellar biosynthesis anti-sigma factor FlgM [Lachnospiraceae bacterium]MCR5476106.1 flagellar biosynthesis anti-sigma factor FlgM [Lachnospiraceae bacterium]
MRIEAYTNVQNLYNTQKAKQAQKPVSAPRATDKVQISSFGQDLATAKAALKGAADIREDVVAPIKKQIADGTYSVSAESFADKLLQKYQEMR